jgi:hypothetical protein
VNRWRRSVGDDVVMGAFFVLLCTTALGLILLAGCPAPAPPPPVVPPGSATCADVCRRYQQLGCLAGRPTPKGSSCEVVCLNVQASGAIRWNLDCRAGASTCAEADRCEQR